MTGYNKHLRAFDIVKSRKIAGSVFLPLTGYIEAEKFFEITKVDKKVYLKEVKIVDEE